MTNDASGRFEIEPGIRALVDALNATGLLETVTSCEGHYGQRREDGDCTDRQQANVGFELRPGISEQQLVRFFGKVLADYVQNPVQWEATFEITKKYVPDLTGNGEVDETFFFTIRPFDPSASDLKRRNGTDTALAVITESVRRHGGAAGR